MAKYSRQSKGKEIRPIFFVFCEGESEEAYVSFIRSTYKVPIQIRAKTAKTKINQNYVSRIIKALPKHKKDKFFLFYDLDRAEMLEKLKSIKNTILLASNPCIELWFILHTFNHTKEASSQQCIDQLKRICKSYSKGTICDKLKHELLTGEDEATKRAKKLILYQNPSTSVFRLIEEIQNVDTKV